MKYRYLTPYFTGENSLLLNSVLLPKIWEKEVGRHDVYNTHIWPMHLLNLHPMVWYPNEPLRIINDLKFEQPFVDCESQIAQQVHTYPKATYDLVNTKVYAATQSVISIFDQTGAPDCIVANSRFCGAQISATYGVNIDSIAYPGINVEDFFYLPPEENLILCVNQLWPHKRVNILIEAMQYVESGQLYIVGEGPEKAALKAQAKSLGLEDRIFFMGSVTNEELAILYARASCCVFAPVREPFGIVALEAMAAGKPLVAVNQGGYVEALNPEVAFLVNPIPFEFAEKINYLLSHKDVATRMGLAGRKVAAEYTWDKMANGLLQAIENVYDSSRCVASGNNTAKEQTLIGVDYFVWYGKGAGAAHWNDNKMFGTVVQKPLLGYYSSDSGEIIRHHLRMLQHAGVDFLAVNIHLDESGVNGYELAAAERMAEIIENDGFSIRQCPQICIYSMNVDTVVAGIKKITDKLAKYSSLLTWDCQPVCFLFWSGFFDGDADACDKLRHCLEDWTVLASSLRIYDKTNEDAKTYGLFDGWSLFSPLEIAEEQHREKLLLQTYENQEAGNKQIRIFTCSPGYDDTALDDPRRNGNRLRHIDRQSGALFEEMLKMSTNLPAPPHIVKISTFNEFHENTHIEPTIEFGSVYIDLLREYSGRIKGAEK